MNHPLLPVLAALFAGTLSFACKTQPSDVSQTQTTSATEQSGMKAALATEDQEFLRKAAQGGQLEFLLGREVSQKAASPEIKAFAKRMVTDHGKANDELKQLAAKKGVTLPVELDEDHREKLDELTKLSGKKLDREYADDMVDDHEEDIDEFRDAAREVKDPEVRAFVDKTLPILQSHLAAAKELKAKTAY